MWHVLTRAGALAGLLCLAACGGGGSSGGATTAQAVLPASVNAAAAWNSLLHNSRSWAVSGTGSDGKAYSLAYSLAPGGATTANGVAAHATTATATLKQSGVIVSTSTSTLYVQDGTTSVVVVAASDGSCGVTTGAASPSAAAAMNSSGPLYVADMKTGCVKLGLPTDHQVATWSVEPDGGIAYFCFNATDQPLVTVSAQQLCVQVDASGNVGSAARFTYNSGTGLTITMR